MMPFPPLFFFSPHAEYQNRAVSREKRTGVAGAATPSQEG